MTFIPYARARRLGLALKNIRNGRSVIETQVESGYQSGSGFRDAFSRLMGDLPSNASLQPLLEAAWIDTRLGPMMAIADESKLYLLEFVDRRALEREIELLGNRMKASILPGRTAPMDQIEIELHRYFT